VADGLLRRLAVPLLLAALTLGAHAWELTGEFVYDDFPYIVENTAVQVTFHEQTPISIDLPGSVELVVKHTEPGLKGDSVSNVFKPATLETGAVVRVPLFIQNGEMIKCNTRTGEYISRA